MSSALFYGDDQSQRFGLASFGAPGLLGQFCGKAFGDAPHLPCLFNASNLSSVVFASKLI